MALDVAAVLARALERHQAGAYDEADRLYREVLTHVPDDADALHLFGVLLHQRGDLAAATTLIERATAVRPGYAAALANLGTLYREAGRAASAAAAYEAAIAAAPAFAQAYGNLATVYVALGRRPEAIAALARSLQLEPQQAKAGHYLVLSKLQFEEGCYEDAAASARAAAALEPESAAAAVNLSAALNALGSSDEAADLCAQALARHPNEPSLLGTLALALNGAGRAGEAEETARAALRLDPRSLEAHSVLASILDARGDVAGAIAQCRAGVAAAPESGLMHAYLGATLLTHGDLRAGWPEYEWLWRPEMGAEFARFASKPRWNGERFDGRTLLLTNEQGLGDALQMLRFLPDVKARGGSVVLECDDALRELVAPSPFVDRLVRKGDAIDPASFDLHVSLFSIPRVFAIELASIPAPIPYVRADDALVRSWRERLGTSGAFRAGIVWAGNPRHRQDRQRSATLATFAPLARVPGVEWIGLQKGAREDDPDPPGMRVTRLGPQLRSFADTAAVIAQLDVVIAVDTAVVHLAGAMGKPVWVLIAKNADWRWLRERSDTPWYPTMRLFRQSVRGEWGPAIEAVHDALARAANGRK